MQKVTLEDFEKRYQFIRETNKHVKTCSINGCSNPRDTTSLGEDSCCAYHRLLFDYWTYEVMGPDFDKLMNYMSNQRARRAAFTRWRNKLGKEQCDKIVLKLAQDGINWVC
jgi:hypothetical protein